MDAGGYEMLSHFSVSALLQCKRFVDSLMCRRLRWRGEEGAEIGLSSSRNEHPGCFGDRGCSCFDGCCCNILSLKNVGLRVYRAVQTKDCTARHYTDLQVQTHALH